jgi:hypothetical protein
MKFVVRTPPIWFYSLKCVDRNSANFALRGFSEAHQDSLRDRTAPHNRELSPATF